MKTSTIKIALLSLSLGLTGMVNAQVKFTNANSVLHSQTGVLGSNAGNHSGNTLIVVDVDNNGMDDISKLDENRYLRVEYQQGGATFTIANSVFDIGAGLDDIWGASMADVDHNGYKDYLYAGWGSGARLIKLNGTGTGNLGITSLPSGGGIASQNCNFMDVNNDGWEDIFVCNDVNENMIWVNNGAGNFPAEANNTAIDFDVTPGATAPNDESGNYGSVWTDFDGDGDVDLYIAHCRQGQPSLDLRRYDVVFENNGSNVYTSTAATHGSIYSDSQDWTSSFGDIDNDGDFDLLLTGHAVTPDERLFINDGNGNFSPNSSQTTVSFNSSSWAQQGLMEDFDNDGWIDIIVTGGAQQVIHRNNGDNTFTLVDNTALGFGAADFFSFAAGDLNHDGQIDLYTSYGSIYNTPGSSDDVLWLNSTNNNNNWLTLDLRGTMSTDGALGARAYIYGAWGVQTREVRASESYGTMNSFMLHFGLGTETTVDSVVVDWPAVGSPSTVITNPTVNQFVTIIEGTCVSPDNTITYTGSPVICSPGTLTLNAPVGAGYSYLWSTGATTPSINVAVGGNYNVRVTEAGNACISWSPIVDVQVDPNQTPTISINGPTTFCPGGSVDLTSSEPTGNTWSTTATSQTINVTSAGSYTVDFAGACQSWTSAPIVVTLLGAPSAPVTTDDLIPSPGTGSLTATGADIDWYDAATGGTMVGSGSPFTTPFVAVNTIFYAEDHTNYGALTANMGQTDHAGTQYNGATYNGFLVFDVVNNATLNTVKVYTNTAGNRTIELRNSIGAVINSVVVNIPADTSVITLNFPLTPGTGYELGTNDAANTALFGDVSPILMRSTSGVVYPYTLAGGAVSITTASAGANYYYFYDWNVTVDPTDVCASPRTPAIVNILSGIENENIYNVLVYPNPASDFINVEFTAPESGEATLSVFDMLGKKVYDMNVGVVNGHVIRTINTSTYADGVYTIQLNLNNINYSTRVVVK